MKPIKREKIGTEYFRSGYGRSKPRKANIYLIDGYAYAKDSANEDTQYNPIPAELGLSGYVRVNQEKSFGHFHQVSGLSSKHLPYVQEKAANMTVKNLIEVLSKHNPDANVRVRIKQYNKTNGVCVPIVSTMKDGGYEFWVKGNDQLLDITVNLPGEARIVNLPK